MKSEKLPFEGIKVLDVGVVWAIPIAARLLAGNGAEVIHVEWHRRLDNARFGDHADNEIKENYWETGGRFHALNLNKKSLCLDLSHPKGLRWFKELVKISDVVMENYAPRVMSNLGLDYPSLREIKPDIIMISASGFGHTGPWRDYKAYGPAIEALSGITDLTGYLDGPPLKSTIPYADITATMFAYLATVAALNYRRRTGKGQWIDLSEYETLTNVLGDAFTSYSMGEKTNTHLGNRHPFMAPHGCYRCQGDDKWITIAISSDEEWGKFMEVIDSPTWSNKERFSSTPSRHKNQDELDKLIEARTVDRNAYELMSQLQRFGIAAGAVLNAKEMLLDPHLRKRECFQVVDYSKSENIKEVGKRVHLRHPWQIAGKKRPPLKPSSSLGQHNHEILVELLGMKEEEFKELVEEEVVSNIPIGPIRTASFSPLPIPFQVEIGRFLDYDLDYKKILGLE